MWRNHNAQSSWVGRPSPRADSDVSSESTKQIASGETAEAACETHALPGSYRLEGGLQIVDQIAHVLNTDRKPDKRVGDAKRFALFSRHGRVCHKRRMIDQAFDTAQTFRERKKMRIFKKTPRTREIGFQNHRDHSAETAHLHAREIMLRMRLESGIAD